MVFNNNDDLKRFAKILTKKMENIGEDVLAKELINWNNDFFTTSSEFLGELKLILERIKQIKSLDAITKKDVTECIATINRAIIM